MEWSPFERLSRQKLCIACMAWVVTVGTVLVAWNVHAGYTIRAKVVGLLMAFGALVYAGDMLTTMYREQAAA